MITDIYSIAKKELEIDEELLWYGAPKPKMITSDNNFKFMLELSFLLILILLIIGIIGNINTFSILYIIVLIVGMSLLNPYILEYKDYKKTVYVITNKRCIIIVCKKKKIVDSYLITDLQYLERKIDANNIGTIIFDKEIDRVKIKGGYRERVKQIGFIRIEEFKKVEEILRNIVS